MTVCAGRTIIGMTVRRRTLEKNMETLSRGVSDRHHGRAGWTVERMTVRHMCPLKDTWKNERPLRTGSLTTRLVVQSVTCVRWDRVLGLLERTL